MERHFSQMQKLCSTIIKTFLKSIRHEVSWLERLNQKKNVYLYSFLSTFVRNLRAMIVFYLEEVALLSSKVTTICHHLLTLF